MGNAHGVTESRTFLAALALLAAVPPGITAGTEYAPVPLGAERAVLAVPPNAGIVDRACIEGRRLVGRPPCVHTKLDGRNSGTCSIAVATLWARATGTVLVKPLRHAYALGSPFPFRRGVERAAFADGLVMLRLGSPNLAFNACCGKAEECSEWVITRIIAHFGTQ